MIKCAKCGKELADNARFCTECGTPAPAAKPASAPQTAAQQPVMQQTTAQPSDDKQAVPVYQRPVAPAAPVTPTYQSQTTAAPTASAYQPQTTAAPSASAYQPQTTAAPSASAYQPQTTAAPGASAYQPQTTAAPSASAYQQQTTAAPTASAYQQQPAYRQPVTPAAPAPTADRPAPSIYTSSPAAETDPGEKVLGVGGFLGTVIVERLPLIGFIMTIIWAISAKNRNRRNYARAELLLLVIGIAISVLLGILGFTFLSSVFDDIVRGNPEFFRDLISSL